MRMNKLQKRCGTSGEVLYEPKNAFLARRVVVSKRPVNVVGEKYGWERLDCGRGEMEMEWNRMEDGWNLMDQDRVWGIESRPLDILLQECLDHTA